MMQAVIGWASYLNQQLLRETLSLEEKEDLMNDWNWLFRFNESWVCIGVVNNEETVEEFKRSFPEGCFLILGRKVRDLRELKGGLIPQVNYMLNGCLGINVQ
jgi:hypothetical protein